VEQPVVHHLENKEGTTVMRRRRRRRSSMRKRENRGRTEGGMKR